MTAKKHINYLHVHCDKSVYINEKGIVIETPKNEAFVLKTVNKWQRH